MANHKRNKPRKSRGHCHLCKGHKDVGNSKSGLHISRIKDNINFNYELQQLAIK